MERGMTYYPNSTDPPSPHSRIPRMTQAMDDYLMSLADQLSQALDVLEANMNQFEVIAEDQMEEEDIPPVQLRQKRRRQCKQKKKGDQSIPDRVVTSEAQLTKTRVAVQIDGAQQRSTPPAFHFKDEDFPPL